MKLRRVLVPAVGVLVLISATTASAALPRSGDVPPVPDVGPEGVSSMVHTDDDSEGMLPYPPGVYVDTGPYLMAQLPDPDRAELPWCATEAEKTSAEVDRSRIEERRRSDHHGGGQLTLQACRDPSASGPNW